MANAIIFLYLKVQKKKEELSIILVKKKKKIKLYAIKKRKEELVHKVYEHRSFLHNIKVLMNLKKFK